MDAVQVGNKALRDDRRNEGTGLGNLFDSKRGTPGFATVVLGASAVTATAQTLEAATIYPSPWTALELDGGFENPSEVNSGGTGLSVSTESIGSGSTSQDLVIHSAYTGSIPSDFRISFWNDLNDFEDGYIGNSTLLELGIPNSAVDNVPGSYGQTISLNNINVLQLTFNDDTLGATNYTNLVNYINSNPNNVFSLYGAGDFYTSVSNNLVTGDSALILEPAGVYDEFTEGIANKGQFITPEPGTSMLIALGALTAILKRRRQSNLRAPLKTPTLHPLLH